MLSYLYPLLQCILQTKINFHYLQTVILTYFTAGLTALANGYAHYSRTNQKRLQEVVSDFDFNYCLEESFKHLGCNLIKNAFPYQCNK